MSRRAKRRQKIAQNPANVRFSNLQYLLEDYGFILDRTRGSHHIFLGVIDGESVSIVIPFRKPVNSVYVLRVLALIERIAALEDQEEDDDSEL